MLKPSEQAHDRIDAQAVQDHLHSDDSHFLNAPSRDFLIKAWETAGENLRGAEILNTRSKTLKKEAEKYMKCFEDHFQTQGFGITFEVDYDAENCSVELCSGYGSYQETVDSIETGYPTLASLIASNVQTLNKLTQSQSFHAVIKASALENDYAHLDGAGTGTHIDDTEAKINFLHYGPPITDDQRIILVIYDDQSDLRTLNVLNGEKGTMWISGIYNEKTFKQYIAKTAKDLEARNDQHIQMANPNSTLLFRTPT